MRVLAEPGQDVGREFAAPAETAAAIRDAATHQMPGGLGVLAHTNEMAAQVAALARTDPAQARAVESELLGRLGAGDASRFAEDLRAITDQSKRADTNPSANVSARSGGTNDQVSPQSAHYYSNRSRVIPCTASDAQIVDLARRFAAPGQPAAPISNGQRSIASTPVGSGPVRSTYYSHGDYGTSVITTLNVTLPGHPLHNGSVSRDWFRGADGAVWVETVGRGKNTSDFMAGANSVAGPPIFRGVDADAAAYAAKNICGRQ